MPSTDNFCTRCTTESWTPLLFSTFFLLRGSPQPIYGGAPSSSSDFFLVEYMYTHQGASDFLMNACVGEGVKKATEEQ